MPLALVARGHSQLIVNNDVTKEKSIYDKNTPHLNNNSSNGTYQNAFKETISEKDSNVKNYSKNLPAIEELQKENNDLDKRLKETQKQIECAVEQYYLLEWIYRINICFSDRWYDIIY